MADKRLSLLILGGLVIGVGSGLLVRQLGIPADGLLSSARFFGELFLRGLFMLILPLVVPMIITGIQKLTETEALGKIGTHALLAILGLTAIAATIGLSIVLLIEPGKNFPAAELTQLTGSDKPPATTTLSWQAILLSLLPKNPLHEMAMIFAPGPQQGSLIAVVSFSILFGIALARLPVEVSRPTYQVLESLFEASQWLLWRLLKWLGPLGVTSLTFSRRTLLRGAHLFPPGLVCRGCRTGPEHSDVCRVFPLSVFSEQAFARSGAFTFYAGAADGFLLIQ